MTNPGATTTIIDWTSTDLEALERIRDSLDRHIIELRAKRKSKSYPPLQSIGPRCDICGLPATHRENGDLTSWTLCDNCGIPGKK